LLRGGGKAMKVVEFNSRGKTYEMKVDDDFEWSRSIRIDRDGYAIVSHDRTNKMLHRVIMDAPSGLIVDHINGDRLDNRKCNLRLVTSKQNSANRKSIGAYYYKHIDKWRAIIFIDNKKTHLGNFDTKEEAVHVYRKAHVEAHGEYSPYYKELNGGQVYDE